jgi:DNA polymerase-3 subunit epsilon
MADQPGLWEQNDLLGLLNPRPPAIASEPVGDAASAPVVSMEQGSASALAKMERSGADGADEGLGAHESAGVPMAEPLEPGLSTDAPRSAPAPAVPQPIALPSLAPIPRRSGPNAPERILILDTETTSLSPKDGLCIEVGAVLFHVPSRSVLQQLSFLLPCPSNPAEAINGLPAAVTRLPQPLEPALELLMAQVRAAEAVVAHNAAFDRQWFGQGCLPDLSLPWICSMEDIRWPAERQLKPKPSVRDLALAYGVPVWAAHRALTDCQYLVHVFERCTDLEALLVGAQEPRQLYRARLSYAERHLARDAGFRWNDPVAGAWSRRLSQKELESLSFEVMRVERDVLAATLPQTA